MTVPTVERGLLLVVFCSMLIAGERPADPLDLRLLQRGEELPGVAREALDVAPLALGVERVDGQRALARAAGPAADGHLVAGDVEVDPLEVVLPRAADLDRGAGRRSDGRSASGVDPEPSPGGGRCSRAEFADRARTLRSAWPV